MGRSYFVFLSALCCLSASGSKYLNTLNDSAYTLLNSDLNQSIAISNKVITKCKLEENPREYILATLHLGLAHGDEKRFLKSINFLNKAEKLSEEYNLKPLQARVRMELGAIIFQYCGYVPDELDAYRIRALELLENSHDYFLSGNDTLNIIKVRNKIANVKESQGKLLEAISLYTSAFDLGIASRDSLMISQTTQNLASIYYQKEKYDSLLYWSSISERFIKTQQKEVLIVNFINKGLAYFMKEDDTNALKHYLQAEILLEQHSFPNLQKIVYDNLAQYHSITGDFEMATAYFDASQVLTDSLNRVQKQLYFSIAQERFHTKDLKIQKSQAQKKSQRLLLLSIGILVSGLSIGLWLNQKRKNAQQSLVMEKQKFSQQIEQQENKNLQAILDALEEERTRIAADIHDRIGAGISTAKLYFEGMKELVGKGNKQIEENFKHVDELLSTSIGEVRKVSHNMISGVLGDFGLVPALQDLQETIQKSGKIEFFIETNVGERLEKNIEINVYRVIQELVSNSIKHAQCTSIHISLKDQDNNLVVSYKDNGIGFSPSKASNGLGHKNISSRIVSLKGTYRNDSKKETGAKYYFTIPFNYPPIG